MITEERMRELLASAAEPYAPPAEGAAAVLRAAVPAGPTRARRRWRVPQVTGRRLSITALASVLVVAAGLAVADQPGDRPTLQGVGQSIDSSADGGGQYLRGQTDDRRLSATTTLPRAPAGVVPGQGITIDVTPARGSGSAGEPAKVVSTGSVVVEVKKGSVDEVMDAITTTAVGTGGYVTNSRTSTSDGRRSGAVTVRVPTDRFDAMAAEVGGLGRILRRETNGQDVSGEYADVEAQLRVLTTTRDSLLQVLAAAREVGDILSVQDRLDTVQTKIEQLQGRQKLLDEQVAMATLSVALVEPAKKGSAAAGEASSWDKAVDGFTGTWSAVLARSGTALALVLFVAGLLAAAVVLARWVRRTHARLVV